MGYLMSLVPDEVEGGVILGNYFKKLEFYYSTGVAVAGRDNIEIRHSPQCVCHLDIDCNCDAVILVNGYRVKEGLA
jgi:hypothetical protein